MAFVYILESGERHYQGSIDGVFEGNPEGLKLARDSAQLIMDRSEYAENWVDISRAHFASLIDEWVAGCDYVKIRKLHVEQAPQPMLFQDRTLPSCIPTFSPRFS